MANPRTPNDDEVKVLRENIRNKFKKMFLNQEPPAYTSVREVEAMRARIRELEAELTLQESTNEKATRSTGVKASDSSPTEVINRQQTKPEETKHLQANALRAAWILMGAALVTAPVYVYLIAQTDTWQLKALFWTSIGVIIEAIVSVFLARRGRVSLSMALMIGTLCLLLPGISALISGLGIVLGVSLMALALVIVGQTLRGSSAIWMGAAGILASVVSLLIDLFWPWNRLSVPELQFIIPVLIITTIPIMGFTIIKQFLTYSLQIKLVVVVAGLVLGSVIAAAWVTSRIVRTEIGREVDTNLAALAQGKALEIGAMIDRDKDTLQVLTSNKVLHDQLEAANILGATDPNEINRLDQQWRNATNDNDLLIWHVLNNTVASELQKFRSQFPQFVEVFVTNQYGTNTASTNRTSDFYQADEEWWQTAWNNGKGGIFISQPVFDDSAGIYAIDIALPIQEHDHPGIIGILRATVDVTPLKETLLAGQFGQTGRVDLVFPDHQFLDPTSENTLATLNAESAARLAALNQTHGGLVYQGVPSLIGKSLVSASSAHADEKINTLGWYVVIHQDQSEALQPVAATTRTMILISLVVLILAGALAFYVGRLLTTPLANLTFAAIQVSQGNLTVQARVNSRDEIGTLAAAFNSMTRQLRDLLGSLEQRVTERTRDLELATEVGRRASQKVANLDELLSETTALIRDRFDLYYTQIYLIDPNKRMLILRAGTGEVGAELMRRNHRLMVSSGSINGRAVSDKQAIIVSDTAQSANFLPNPLLPNTRSEMAVPLIAAGHVVGVLDMQSEQPGALNEANLPAFEALAGQLAIAIQNASLFAEAEQARSEMEAQAQRLTSSGWQEFLNAVDRSETIGYSFNENEIRSLTETQKTTLENALVLPIEVAGASIGEVQLSDEASRAWAAEETEIVRATMSQMAQHIENLRLLAQAERYRAEAEQAVRRLTREGWDAYLQGQNEETTTFAYNLNEVYPLNESGDGHHSSGIIHPLTVHNEVVGELSVDVRDGSQEEAKEIISTIAAQLSAHIDNLRLSISNMSLLKSTEELARREQILRQITGTLRSSNNPATIMRTAVRELGSILGRRAVVQLISPRQANQAASAVSNENKSDAPGDQF